jgi:hypothetical protein
VNSIVSEVITEAKVAHSFLRKPTIVGSAMAPGFGRPAALVSPAVSHLLPGWRAPACALRDGSNLRRAAELTQRSAMTVILGIGSLSLPEVDALLVDWRPPAHCRMAVTSGDRGSVPEGAPAWNVPLRVNR